MTDKIDTPAAAPSKISRLFDVRLVIGAVLIIYGLILLVTGLLDGQAAVQKAAGTRINLWTGIALLVFGLLFLLWMRLNPLHVGGHEDESDGAG